MNTKNKSDITPLIIKMVGILNKGKIDYNFTFRKDFIRYNKKTKTLAISIKNPHGFWFNRKLKKEVSKLKCLVDGIHDWKLVGITGASVRMKCKHCKTKRRI